jgi:hypothetical protein
MIQRNRPNRMSPIITVEKRPEVGIVITPPRKAIDEFYWNPSITRHKGELYVSLRGYTVESTIWGHWRSTLAVGKLVDDKVVDLRVLIPPSPDDVNSNRLEDVRLWSDGEKLWAIGNHLSMPSGRVNQEQAEAIIDYDNSTYEIVNKFGNPLGRTEKNWSPIDGQPHTYLHSIGTITRDGWIKAVDTTPNTIEPVHNGTPLIKIKDGYIGIFHQRAKLINAQRYGNIFIKFDDDLKPTHQSKWFVFGDEGHQEVQFISGMVLLEKDILGITLGIDRIQARTPADYKGLFYKVDLNHIWTEPFDYNNLVIRRGRLAA